MSGAHSHFSRARCPASINDIPYCVHHHAAAVIWRLGRIPQTGIRRIGRLPALETQGCLHSRDITEYKTNIMLIMTTTICKEVITPVCSYLKNRTSDDFWLIFTDVVTSRYRRHCHDTTETKEPEFQQKCSSYEIKRQRISPTKRRACNKYRFNSCQQRVTLV